MILKLRLHQRPHLKKQISTRCTFTGNRKMCQELLSLTLPLFFLSLFFSCSWTPLPHLKPFWRKMSALKCLKTELVRRSAWQEAGGRRTIQHLLGDGRCWRAAAGSHFPSINMVGILLSVILRRAQKTHRWGVWCALGMVDDMTWILHNIFKILDGTGLYHTVTACFLL